MNTSKLSYLLFILIGLLSYQSSAQQEKRRINIKYYGFLEKDEVKYPGATILTKDNKSQVEIFHKGITLWCDNAIHYAKEDFIEAFGNVRVNQGDTITMTSKYIEYSGLAELAFARGDVVLKNPNSTILTEKLHFDRLKQEAFFRENGTVVRDSSGTITSQIGRYYINEEKYQFVKDVVLVNPDYTINSDRLDFYSESGYAYLFGPSTIVTDDSKTYCERGFFDTENKTGYAVKNSKIFYDNRIVEGDSLYFDNRKNFASATNNIKVTDTINNAVAKGHYAEVYKDQDLVYITKRALAITVQENDSIYMHSDTIKVTGKPEHRITKAYYNAKIFKSNLSGKADSIHVDHKLGITKLINLSRINSTDAFAKKRNPVLWNINSQMTGDTIQLIANTKMETLDTLKVFNDALVVSKDTLGSGYNQIIGKELIGFFRDNKLHQVDIIKNAESIFYSRDENDELVAIDRSKSGLMSVFFSEDNSIERIRKEVRETGNIYPEGDFPVDQQLFRDFVWRDEERPKSLEDLFKDDPPLNLPIIMGLDEYVPQTDFFDNELLERINNAGSRTLGSQDGEPKENKAARNIPKSTQKATKADLKKTTIKKQN